MRNVTRNTFRWFYLVAPLGAVLILLLALGACATPGAAATADAPDSAHADATAPDPGAGHDHEHGHEDGAAHHHEHGHADAHASDADVVAAQLPHYPLEVCAVTGGPLGGMGEPDDYVTEGRLVRLCCAGCRQALEDDREAIVARLDEAVKEAQRADYPLDVCVVSGERLDDHGGAVEVVVEGRLVKVCCPGCARELRADPARFLKALDEGRAVETPEEGGHSGHDHHGH